MVLANGSIITASEDSHQDLFWVIRGAGHNFGIAVEATFKVYPQTNGGIHHNWDFGFELDKCEALFELLNEVHAAMPPDLAIFVLWKRMFPTGEKVRGIPSSIFAQILTRMLESHSHQPSLPRTRIRSFKMGISIRESTTARQQWQNKYDMARITLGSMRSAK